MSMQGPCSAAFFFHLTGMNHKNTVSPEEEGGKASRTGEGQESCEETMHRADANVRLRQAIK